MTKEIYRVKGELQQGFVGHITYTTILPLNIYGIKIDFCFDKRNTLSPELFKQKVIATIHEENLADENINKTTTLDELADYFVQRAKTEINVSVFVDDYCVGSAHRDEIEKNIIISSQESSKGFVAYNPSGVIKIVMHVLNVLNDNTNYSICLSSFSEHNSEVIV